MIETAMICGPLILLGFFALLYGLARLDYAISLKIGDEEEPKK